MGLAWPDIQRAVPGITPVTGAWTTQINIMQAGREMPLVDVPFGKYSRLHPIDPYGNGDIDSESRRMLQPKNSIT